MPTNKPRFIVTVDDEMFKEIEDYRFDNRFYSRSEATVSLMKLGLEAISKMSPEELDKWVETVKKEEGGKK